MAIDEQLLNQPKVKTGQEQYYADGLRREQSEQENADTDASNQEDQAGYTNNQMMRTAMIAQENKAAAASAAEGSAGALEAKMNPLTNILRGAEEMIPTPAFLLGLSWVNIHVIVLNKVFGKKLFCDLGEEWSPNDKNRAASLGLAEKMALILIDAFIIIVLLIIVFVIVAIINLPQIFIDTALSLYQNIHSSVGF